MNAEYKRILQSLQLKQFAPVYLVDGEENYYLDKITDMFENNILSAAERDLTSLYSMAKMPIGPTW